MTHNIKEKLKEAAKEAKAKVVDREDPVAISMEAVGRTW